MLECLFVAINARYIHTNNAVRLLKANSLFVTEYVEYTIHDCFDDIYQKIISQEPLTIGFSCYIWNIEMIVKLCKKIKNETSIKVFLGGPEVTYDARYFLDESGCDLVVKGEGEFVIDDVLYYLLHGDLNVLKSNVSVYHEGVFHDTLIQEISDLSVIKSPHYFEKDIPYLSKRIVYIETSRGCPYRCSYCLSSLEKKVRYFDIKKVFEELSYLIKHGALRFKFLDRTFNANKDYLTMIDFIINNHPLGSVFQFEMTGDTLSIDNIDYINQYAPKGLFRFEIGIQTINRQTNLLVDRVQNNTILFNNIKAILGKDVITLHLDLITGLPKETLTSFINTFDLVYALNAQELQLGFLKMLRGTKILREASLYQYQFNLSPPYEIISNDVLSRNDIEIIKAVEKTLNIFHNKNHFGSLIYSYAMTHKSSFHFFLDLYHLMIKMKVSFLGYQRDDLYRVIDVYSDDPVIREQFISHYLYTSKVKPKKYFEVITDKTIKNKVFSVLSIHTKFREHDYYKHSVLIKTLEGYSCFLYQNNLAQWYKLTNQFIPI